MVYEERFRRFLEDNDLMPLSNWECFELFHVKPLSESDKKSTVSEIKKNVDERSGLYVYEKDGEILYVGTGKSLLGRIRSHYWESYASARNRDTEIWHKFFSSHQGRVKVFWRELEEEKIRQIIEQMLQYILKPKFESFRKKYA